MWMAGLIPVTPGDGHDAGEECSSCQLLSRAAVTPHPSLSPQAGRGIP